MPVISVLLLLLPLFCRSNVDKEPQMATASVRNRKGCFSIKARSKGRVTICHQSVIISDHFGPGPRPSFHSSAYKLANIACRSPLLTPRFHKASLRNPQNKTRYY
ncbi:hypothetical protein FB451DRAFT_580610 [Mycena latifolia]|nr:hypothetical protein FB451DRAFT_580610 [Mycena latifolia]